VNRAPWPVWIAVALWCAWLGALGGAWRTASPDGGFVPDLALVLALALAAHVDRAELPWLLAAVVLGRMANAIEAPIAVIACLLMCTLVVRASHGVVEITRPLPRALIAGCAVLLAHAWFALVHSVRVDAADPLSRTADAQRFDVLGELLRALPAAAATALVALLLGGVVTRLPGLGPFARRRAWRVSASRP
jgi:hypothetical protein